MESLTAAASIEGGGGREGGGGDSMRSFELVYVKRDDRAGTRGKLLMLTGSITLLAAFVLLASSKTNHQPTSLDVKRISPRTKLATSTIKKVPIPSKLAISSPHERSMIQTRLTPGKFHTLGLKQKGPTVGENALKHLRQDVKLQHVISASTNKRHRSILAATKRISLKFPKSRQILDDMSPEALSVNQTNETFSAKNADDYNEDRSKESVFSQIFRTPLTYHLVRTVDHYLPDTLVPNSPPVKEQAQDGPHTILGQPEIVFDDDKDVIIKETKNEEPIPLSERDPDYYPGGEFKDVTRRVNSTKDTPLSGRLHDDDEEVPQGAPVDMNLSYVGERNFEGFADDVNEEIPQVKVKVHPADHTGPEFDAGGWLNDMLRKPDAVGDPLERDRLINIPPTKMVEAQEPNSNVPLELGDSVVDASEANDDPALQDLGIPYSKEEVSKPQGEENYKYGLLADFQDRDVKVQPIVAASQAVAQVWEREEEEASEKSKIEGSKIETKPVEIAD